MDKRQLSRTPEAVIKISIYSSDDSDILRDIDLDVYGKNLDSLKYLCDKMNWKYEILHSNVEDDNHHLSSDSNDIELIMSQCNCLRYVAESAYKESNGDLMSAILKISENH